MTGLNAEAGQRIGATVYEPPRDEYATGGGHGMTVLVVEDEPTIVAPLVRVLERAGFRAVAASTGSEALAQSAAARPDVILLDLALPDLDGREVCRRIRRDSAVPIIIVTASGTVTDRVVGLELGADDYIVKPFASGELIARIRAVLRRGRPRDDEEAIPASAGDLRIDPGARRAWQRGRELDLTRREFDLLYRLAEDAGRVVTRETLMSDVWDENWFGSTKTLDVHVGSLRKKLRDDPVHPTYIRTVRGVGFSLSGGDPTMP